MVEKEIRNEIHDMSNKIFELQAKTEHLTNGQRYAAINEIEKSIQPLRNDLRHLEHKLYTQENHDETIRKDIEILEGQINELENIKFDLEQRIHTETEHTRKELNDKIINFMSTELEPIKKSMEDTQTDIKILNEQIAQLKIDMIQQEKNHQIEEAQRTDKLKIIIAVVAGVATGISTLIVTFGPALRTLFSIFF